MNLHPRPRRWFILTSTFLRSIKFGFKFKTFEVLMFWCRLFLILARSGGRALNRHVRVNPRATNSYSCSNSYSNSYFSDAFFLFAFKSHWTSSQYREGFFPLLSAVNLVRLLRCTIMGMILRQPRRAMPDFFSIDQEEGWAGEIEAWPPPVQWGSWATSSFPEDEGNISDLNDLKFNCCFNCEPIMSGIVFIFFSQLACRCKLPSQTSCLIAFNLNCNLERDDGLQRGWPTFFSSQSIAKLRFTVVTLEILNAREWAIWWTLNFCCVRALQMACVVKKSV